MSTLEGAAAHLMALALVLVLMLLLLLVLVLVARALLVVRVLLLVLHSGPWNVIWRVWDGNGMLMPILLPTGEATRMK